MMPHFHLLRVTLMANGLCARHQAHSKASTELLRFFCSAQHSTFRQNQLRHMRTEFFWHVSVARLHGECGSTTYTLCQQLMEA